MNTNKIILSIVSHENCQDIIPFLSNNHNVLDKAYISIIVRINIPEDISQFDEIYFKDATLKVVCNTAPMGFGRNHNENFKLSCSSDNEIFIVCNPDLISISENVFENLLDSKIFTDKIIYTPKILNEDLSSADYIRGPIYFTNLFKRFLFNQKHTEKIFLWSPSVFKCFPVSLFKKLNGYDANIFMYYEDYDICMRARAVGSEIKVLQTSYIVHKANRGSRRNLKLLYHHIRSILYVTSKKKRIEYQ